MKTCPLCRSENIKYLRARISRKAGTRYVVAVYYCYDCHKENYVRQKIDMLPGMDEATKEFNYD